MHTTTRPEVERRITARASKTKTTVGKVDLPPKHTSNLGAKNLLGTA